MRTAIIVSITAMLILSGCAGAIPEKAQHEATHERQITAQAHRPLPAEQVIAVAAAYPQAVAPIGSGEITFAPGVALLHASKESLIVEFMHAYYRSLASLETQETARFFMGDSADAAETARLVWDASVAIRAMQSVDLTLSGYSFALSVQSVTKQDNGDIQVRVSEDFTKNFTAYPGVNSKGFAQGHIFTFRYESGAWLLSEYRKTAFVLGHYIIGRRRGGDAPATTPQQRRDGWVREARRAAMSRHSQGSEPGDVRYDNPYNRQAAVDYARRWATAERNPAFTSYDRMGGNCQNFTSQALLAGGIPMDYTAPAQWKWFGDTPSTSFTASGRAPAWTGVNEFLTYVRSNSGFGMVAFADAPYFSGQPGDIIHMGFSGNFRHTVMITDVMTDEYGQAIDYLIASNTANLLDFPVSAYHYQEQMLIRIFGWNN